ncbi:unnamed protein product [Caenorhabditis brenneri]
MGTTYSTPISAESTEPKSSDESSDSEYDKIEELEAYQCEALVESSNILKAKGNEENGDRVMETTVAETASLLETTSLSENTSENGTEKEVVGIEEMTNWDSASDLKQVEDGEGQKEKSEEVLKTEKKEESLEDVKIDSFEKQQQQAEFREQRQAGQFREMAQILQQTQTTVMNEKTVSTTSSSFTLTPNAVPPEPMYICEICDQTIQGKEKYLSHLQSLHKQMTGKCLKDMAYGAPLACSRCRDRLWTFEGLERHLVMSHGLVTPELLQKAQKKKDSGRCKICGKQYEFYILHHLAKAHQVKLCSAELIYCCDVCGFKCSNYEVLESHLSSNHPRGVKKASPAKEDNWEMLDDKET